MAPHESDDEGEELEDAEFESSNVDPEEGIDEDLLDAVEAATASQGASDRDEDLSEEEDDASDDDEEPGTSPMNMQVDGIEQLPTMQYEVHRATPPTPPQAVGPPAEPGFEPSRTLSPPRQRSLSPASKRKRGILEAVVHPKSYTVEAICALPHPGPTHALAGSLCMTHLLTGSEDGYIRDYDIFSAVNGKNFLTAQQRHHCAVIEGTMKAGQIRYWWENSGDNSSPTSGLLRDPRLSPVYSILMHSDALWALAGSDRGRINLFTVRHEPGKLCHVMTGHQAHGQEFPISCLAMQHDEKGFYSAGWDGIALHWDLNTGQTTRRFTSHGAQLAIVAVRPEPTQSLYPLPKLPQPDGVKMETDGPSGTAPDGGHGQEGDTASDYDPLFDEPAVDEDDKGLVLATSNDLGGLDLAMPGSVDFGGTPWQQQTSASVTTQRPYRPPPVTIQAKNMLPVLESTSYPSFSPDLLMTASIDGQVVLWDRRVESAGQGVGRLWLSEKTPPWCMSACWSADGSLICAGRRNGTVDVWDVRQMGFSGPLATPRILKILRNPLSSGVVSCVAAFPDGKHLACASTDNIRLWNVAEANEPDAHGKVKSGVQFKIIPGHHGGLVSQMLIDPAARFLVSASSNRGWHGESTRTVFVHDVKHNL